MSQYNMEPISRDHPQTSSTEKRSMKSRPFEIIDDSGDGKLSST